jgi:hypothetical protein
MFAAAFPDADLSQRLALAPGLLVLCVAAHIYAGTTRYRPQLGTALIVALAVSCVQLARSAVLYVLRA